MFELTLYAEQSLEEMSRIGTVSTMVCMEAFITTFHGFYLL